MNKSKTIFTYHMDIPGFDFPSERKLLALWLDRWRAIGWEPYVLNESQARKHPDFAAFEAKTKTFPTVNNPDYERACYMRWLAISVLGGGIMFDTDVIPRRDWDRNRNLPKKTTSFQGETLASMAPCVFAPAAGYDDFIDFALTLPDGGPADSLETINGKPHYSDMLMWRDYARIKPESIQLDRKVWQYNEPGWEEAAVIHFSRGSTHGVGLRPRWQHIPELIIPK